MRIIILLIFLAQLNCFSQEKTDGKVEYNRILAFTDDINKSDFTLLFNQEISIFYENKKEIEDAKIEPSTDDELGFSFKINLTISSKKPYTVLTNPNKKEIKSQVSLFAEGKKKTYIVEEKIIKIDWNIKNEFKKIGVFNTQKAIGKFRGRIYTAWFTNEIPVKYGPWKLHGLPGLIIEVSDSKKEVFFKANSFTIPYKDKSINYDSIFDKEISRIPLTEYVRLNKLQLEEFKKLLITKLPRGTKVKSVKTTSNSIELEYEFNVNE